MAKSKLIIIGAGETAEMAYEYFTYDSNYKVVAFSVEKRFMQSGKLFGLPVVPFEDIERLYDPQKYELFIAVSFTELNRVRTRLYKQAKKKGYKLASYISSKAFIWRNVTFGENCFVLENNVLQYHVKIGNNVVLWSGNHIGHRTIIHDHTFVSSHVTVCGFCEIGESCFIGVNSTINPKIKIGDDCIIGAGAVVLHDTFKGLVYAGNPARALENKTSYITFNVNEALPESFLKEQQIVSKAVN